MAAWSGWEDEFLTDASLPKTAANRRFLDEWHTNADTDCANNPIDLSYLIPGSTDCKQLTSRNAAAQRYGAHSVASHAFDVQIHAGYASAILAALRSGNPYTVKNYAAVESAIDAWGSSNFAQVYFAHFAPGVTAAHAHTGWADLRHTFNHVQREALPAAQRSLNAGMRATARARKVKIR